MRRHLIQAIVSGACLCVSTQSMVLLAQESSSGRTIHFVGGSSATSWLKFATPDDRRIILSGKINGVAAQMLLDTGVGNLVLSKDFAAKLNLHRVGTVTGVGVARQVQGEVVEPVQISLDTLTVEASAPNLFDLAPLAASFNEPIVALIGADLFDSLMVDLDFDKQLVAFRDPATAKRLSGATELALSRGALGRRRFAISVEGRAPIQASFDLGAEPALILSPDYVAEQKLLAGKRTSTALGGGLSGPEAAQVATLDQLMLGQIAFHHVPVHVPRTWSLDCSAVVGFPVLSRLRMAVDFPHDRVDVLPIPAVISQPFQKDHSGLGARRLQDRLQIVHVAPGSPAEAARLKVGDEVVVMNGEAVGPTYFKSHPSEGSKPPGTTLDLTLSSGAKVRIVLAEYF